MPATEPLMIHGEPSKPIQVWTLDIEGRPYERVAEFDTAAEAQQFDFSRRLDKNYIFRVHRVWMTEAEFAAYSLAMGEQKAALTGNVQDWLEAKRKAPAKKRLL